MNEIVRFGITLFIVTFVASLALALTNQYTLTKIDEQKKLAVTNSLNKVISADDFIEKEGYYEVYKNKEVVGKVLKVELQGYSSIISALVGVDTQGKITGIDVVSQQETPGLGTKIAEESFLKQFIGKEKKELTLKKDGGGIDAVTGATISSRAIVEGIKRVMEEYPYDTLTRVSP